MIRISKRSDIKKRNIFAIRIISVVFALLALAIFIRMIGHNPIEVYKAMIEGSFGTPYRIKETVKTTVPLVIASLGIMMAFKMKFWNIGAEGQILMGAFAGSYVALNFSELPSMLLLPLMMIAGMIGGGLWALIPTIFKVEFGTNETLFTLMMNYIALKWIVYLQYGPWRDPNALGFPKIPNFVDAAILPRVFGVHIGWIIALVLLFVIYMLINHTKLGYEIGVIGNSQNTAKYAGMNVKRVILMSLFISGCLGGLVGIIQASAVSNTLAFEVSGGYGFTAIIVTWLSNMKVMVVPLTAVLFAVLDQGCSYIQTAFQIPNASAEILKGMILIFALGSEFFINYHVTFTGIEKKQNISKSAKEGA